MQISGVSSQQLHQVYSQMRSQQTASTSQQSQQASVNYDPDHDGDIDKPGQPDIDGKGQKVDFRA